MAVSSIMSASYLPEITWVEITLVLTLLALYIYYTWTSAFNYWKHRNVPYLKPKFPFGNVSDVFLLKKHSGEAWQDFYNQLGSKSFGGIFAVKEPVLIVKDPELIKKVLIKDFNHFTDHGLFPRQDHEPLLKNIFNMDGDSWRRMRMKLSPTFTSGKIKMMFPVMDECAKELKLSLENIFKNKGTFEAKDLMGRFTCDIIVNCAFGLRAKSVTNPDCELHRVGEKIFEKSLWRVICNVMLVEMPTAYSLFKMHWLDYDGCQYFEKIIKETIEYREKLNITRNDFLDLMIRLKNNLSIDDKDMFSSSKSNGNMKQEEKSAENSIDPVTLKELMSQIIVFFIAGFETSSSTLSFCLYELARNPDVQIKLKRELDEALERHGKFSYQMLQELPYMEKVIFEALRRYSSLPMLNRVCVKTYKIPDTDIVIEKGCKIIIPNYAIHHDPKYYPDPFKFDPDRFLEESVKSRPAYTFLPFGEGPRICIGMKFAKMQVRLALATLFSEYQLKLNEKTPVPLKITPGQYLTSTKDNILVDLVSRYKQS